MRHPILSVAVLGMMAWTAPVFAQSYPAEATIQQDVEVRSGPSKNFFPTSKLQRNDRVLIIRESKEAPGWLEIKPPPGSFSWINGKFVKQIDSRYAYVDADPTRPAPVLPGSTLVNQEPNREVIKLTMGTLLIIVDRPLTINGETWLPIQPHPSEVRYLPAESVRAATQVATTTSTPNWTLTPNGYTTNSQLADAEQALKTGDVGKARQLFQQVANTATDQNQKVYAMNRLNTLPQGVIPPIQSISVQKSNDSLTAFSPPSASTALGNLVMAQGAAWSTYGRLRETTLKREDGQLIYVLEDSQSRPISYVTTNPGKSLQQYSGRMVAVYGPTMYRPDSATRLQYIVASHVAVP